MGECFVGRRGRRYRGRGGGREDRTFVEVGVEFGCGEADERIVRRWVVVNFVFYAFVVPSFFFCLTLGFEAIRIGVVE